LFGSNLYEKVSADLSFPPATLKSLGEEKPQGKSRKGAPYKRTYDRDEYSEEEKYQLKRKDTPHC
jgi:hypothetical protein